MLFKRMYYFNEGKFWFMPNWKNNDLEEYVWNLLEIELICVSYSFFFSLFSVLVLDLEDVTDIKYLGH